MDDGKRTVLVAALSAYADLLVKNTARLDLEQGKGKGKASDDDVDLAAEIKNQIKLCGELTNSITDATSGKDIARTFEPAGVASKPPKNEHELCEGLKNVFEKNPTASKSQTGNNWWTDSFQEFYPTTAAPKQQTKPSFPKPQQLHVVDNKPYTNPFTGLPVIPETGYEAGPSNRPPAPLREPPRPPALQPTVPKPTSSILVKPTREPPRLPLLSSRPLSLPLEPSFKAPIQPPPKPLHLRAPPIVPPRPTSTRSETLPPQRSAPPLPPLWSHEPQQLQQRLIATATPPEYGLTRMSSVTRKPVATKQQTNILPSQLHVPIVNISPVYPYEQPPIPSSPPFDWETNIQDSREGVPRDGGHVPNPAHKSKYLRHIAELASKALKAAGSMISITRTPSVNQSQSLSPRKTVNVSVEPPVEPADYALVTGNTISHVSTRPPLGSPQWTTSQETFPPAYDTLSHISRRSSLTSRRPTPPTITSPQRSVSPPLSSNITPGVKRSSTWTPSAKTPFRGTSNPSLTSPAVSPGAKLQIGRPGRRYTVNSASNRPVTFGTYMGDHEDADATFARSLHLNDTNSMAWERSSVSSLVSPSINPSLDQRTSYTQKRESATSPPLNPPGSNDSWKDHLAADEAFAKTLQQEEYREIQMERDLLLAYSIANGTAEDGDVELAYFMSQETVTLIASTDAVATGPHTPGASEHASFDPWGIDSETFQMQLDWLEARELQMELRAKDAADEASFSEAKRLQAEFDKEAQNDKAWEDWKKSNIEECIVCGDEQHREELVRPCEHGYCDGCLQDGFKAALVSKTPFKCCQKALSLEGCSGLSAEFVAEYEEMMLELSTPNPMYCCNAQCAKFLPPRVVVGDVGTCEKCRSQTCRHCRRRTHPGTFCEEDKETEAVKNLAKKKGWKTCPGCNHLIERQSGCLHMICSRCQTAFCYRCSKRWKDCESTCPDPISATHPKI